MSHSNQSRAPYGHHGYRGGENQIQPTYQTGSGYQAAGGSQPSYAGHSRPPFAAQNHQDKHWAGDHGHIERHHQPGGSTPRKYRGSSVQRYAPYPPHPSHPPPPAPAFYGAVPPPPPPHLPPQDPYSPYYSPVAPPPPPQWHHGPSPYGAGAAYYAPIYGQYPPQPQFAAPPHAYSQGNPDPALNRNQQSPTNHHNQAAYWNASHVQERPARGRFPGSKQWKAPGYDRRPSAQGTQPTAASPTAAAVSPPSVASVTPVQPQPGHDSSTQQPSASKIRDSRRYSYDEADSYDLENYYSDNPDIDPDYALGVIVWKPGKPVKRAISAFSSDFNDLRDNALPLGETVADGVSAFAQAGEHEQTKPITESLDWLEHKDDPVFANLTQDTSSIPRDQVLANRRAPALPTWSTDGDEEEGEILKEPDILEESKPSSLYIKSEVKDEVESLDLNIENIDDEDEPYSPPPANAPLPDAAHFEDSSDEYDPSADIVLSADRPKSPPKDVEASNEVEKTPVLTSLDDNADEYEPSDDIMLSSDKSISLPKDLGTSNEVANTLIPTGSADRAPEQQSISSPKQEPDTPLTNSFDQEPQVGQIHESQVSPKDGRSSDQSESNDREVSRNSMDYEPQEHRKPRAGYQVQEDRRNSFVSRQQEGWSPREANTSIPNTPSQRNSTDREQSRPSSAQKAQPWHLDPHQEARLASLGVEPKHPRAEHLERTSPLGAQGRHSPHGPQGLQSPLGNQGPQGRRRSSNFNNHVGQHGPFNPPAPPPGPPPGSLPTPSPPPEPSPFEVDKYGLPRERQSSGPRGKTPPPPDVEPEKDGPEKANGNVVTEDVVIKSNDTEAVSKEGDALQKVTEMSETKARTPTPPNIGKSSLRPRKRKTDSPVQEKGDGIKRQKVDTPRSKRRQPQVQDAYKTRW